MNENSQICITSHRDLMGGALVRNMLLCARAELDLTNQAETGFRGGLAVAYENFTSVTQ